MGFLCLYKGLFNSSLVEFVFVNGVNNCIISWVKMLSISQGCSANLNVSFSNRLVLALPARNVISATF